MADPTRLRLVKATNVAALWLLHKRRFVLANITWWTCRKILGWRR